MHYKNISIKQILESEYEYWEHRFETEEMFPDKVSETYGRLREIDRIKRRIYKIDGDKLWTSPILSLED